MYHCQNRDHLLKKKGLKGNIFSICKCTQGSHHNLKICKYLKTYHVMKYSLFKWFLHLITINWKKQHNNYKPWIKLKNNEKTRDQQKQTIYTALKMFKCSHMYMSSLLYMVYAHHETNIVG